MEELSKRHGNEVKEIKESLLRNEVQYKNWLEEAKQDKLTIIEKYEEQLRQLKKEQLLTKLNRENNEIEQLNRNKEILKQLEQKNMELLNEIKMIKLEKESIKKNNIQNQLKNNKLT